MFDVLSDYKTDHFFLTGDQELHEVSNAPKEGMGVFLVYELKNGRINLVYVGAAGKVKHTGRKIAKTGFYEDLINGEHFGGKRPETWKQKLKKEKIDALDIYWYETYNQNIKDIPAFVQGQVIQLHFDMQGRLPEWNEQY
ncbi:hypothetical protein ACW6QP_15300 [Salegentibacter sp. HM20]